MWKVFINRAAAQQRLRRESVVVVVVVVVGDASPVSCVTFHGSSVVLVSSLSFSLPFAMSTRTKLFATIP